MAYCSSDDVTLGDVEIPRFVSKDHYIERAAEDMDAVIGRVYRLPLELDVTDPQYRATTLMLKRINIYLATGKLIMAAAGGGQDDKLHEYGHWCVMQAEEALKAIANGDWPLYGQQHFGDDSDAGSRQPLVLNRDDSSLVKLFYEGGEGHRNPWFTRPGVRTVR